MSIGMSSCPWHDPPYFPYSLVAMWLAVYMLCGVLAFVSRAIAPPSTEPTTERAENSLLFHQWSLFTLLQAGIMAPIAVVALFMEGGLWWSDDPAVRYGHVSKESGAAWLVLKAGEHFVAFELVDLVTMTLRGSASMSIVIHHVIFLCVGCYMRGNCVLMFYAAVLLAQEISNPFLNAMTFLNNRTSGNRPLQVAMELCVGGFTVTFIPFRLVLNMYGAYHFVYNMIIRRAGPDSIPLTDLYVLAVVQAGGALLQVGYGIKLFFCLTSADRRREINLAGRELALDKILEALGPETKKD